jgi:catechol 2,3-dioxygenase-like lactoylglutathione lyase family enzyme
MATVSVRYIVNDVDVAIAFYCGHLGLAMPAGSNFSSTPALRSAFAAPTRRTLRSRAAGG